MSNRGRGLHYYCTAVKKRVLKVRETPEFLTDSIVYMGEESYFSQKRIVKSNVNLMILFSDQTKEVDEIF